MPGETGVGQGDRRDRPARSSCQPAPPAAAAFAGVSGGFSANLLLGTIDPLLAGISQEAARIIDPTYKVTPACNYYFMAASTLVVALAGTWVTERLVVPRLGTWSGEVGEQDEQLGRVYAEIERLNALIEAMESTTAWKLHRKVEKLRGRSS